MTGQPDGTTLLDGEVSVNSGTTNIVMGSLENSTNKNSYGAQQQPAPYVSSICRIEIDGKPLPEDNKVRSLRSQLSMAQTKIKQLEAQQNKLQEKLTAQSKQLLTLSDVKNNFENLDESNLTNALIRRYEYLYSQVRVDVIDALDQFDELKDSSELKIKLLFSIVVLAHRSTEQTFKDLHLNIQKLLKISNIYENVNHEDLDPIYHKVECCIGQYLCVTSAYFDIESNVQNVCSQIWDTLFDYPCLEKCPQLTDFIRQCVRLCWSLHVQKNHFNMDIETKTFREEWHSRTIDSDIGSNIIKYYIWPTLFQHGICVHKGVVVT